MTAAEATPPLEELSAMVRELMAWKHGAVDSSGREDQLAAAQRETQRLREMVSALYLEVAALKAAANPVWEGRDDTGESADDAAHTETTPGRRVRFIDSQGEWQAHEAAEEADGQAQHFIGSPSAGDWRGHDPWMPATSRYPVPSWDYSEPPQTPPGMTTCSIRAVDRTC